MKSLPVTQNKLMIVIVNHGLGSKVLKLAKDNGVKGGTVVYGRGTYNKPILEFLELTDVRKELVWFIMPHGLVPKIMEALNERFKLEKPNHGILFVMPIALFFGFGAYEYEKLEESGGTKMSVYNAIMTIVDKGTGDEVVSAANEAGAKGATIINARGSGIHETTRIFNMEVETEKEIVLILAKQEIVKHIVTTIKEKINIDEPGKGIIFVQEVHQTLGIR